METGREVVEASHNEVQYNRQKPPMSKVAGSTDWNCEKPPISEVAGIPPTSEVAGKAVD